MEFSTHYLLMADHAMLQKLVMSRIKPLGLTTGQPKVLDFLQDHDGAMQKDIAQGCHIEPSSLSTILGGMERAGLLERSTRDENRRTVYVRLTDLGREQCRRLNAIFAAAEEEALRGFSEYRQMVFGAMLVILMLVRPEGLFGSVNFKYIGQRLSLKKSKRGGGSHV